MAEHFEPAMQEFGLEFEEIDDALGGTWAMTLWGCAFEDFLTRRFGPDGENPVEAYLRRRGWKERALTRNYMAALQTSVMSLYEVSDLVPGESFRARDLIRGGEPVLVSEQHGDPDVEAVGPDRGAHCPARSEDDPGRRLARLHAGSVAIAVCATGGSLRTRCQDVTKSAPSLDALDGWNGTDDDLRRAAPLFTTTWLFAVMPRALGTSQPTLFNSEGDEVVFHTVTFPFTSDASREEIARRLGELRPLRQETPTFWNWIGQTSSQACEIP